MAREVTVSVRTKVNAGRQEAMMQALRGRVKRARRRDRPAIIHRGIREIVDTCVRFEIE
jgi:hypothetical protein